MLRPLIVAWPPAALRSLERGGPDVAIRHPEAPARTFEGSDGTRTHKERA